MSVDVELKNCHDCDAEPGEAHKGGCDTERCPFCGGQLIGCDCCYKELAHIYDWDFKPDIVARPGDKLPDGYTQSYSLLDGRFVYSYENSGLPEEVYSEGLNEEQDAAWDAILKAEGVMPWTGVWPGTAECQEFNFYCYWGPPLGDHGWVPCEVDHPDARTDLNRMLTECVWDRANKKFILRT